MKKPTALVILDGWGVNNGQDGNAVFTAKTPNYDNLIKDFPNTVIGASGLDVGLPDGQMGNSEVGHLNIGAGRIIYQALTRITKSIKDGDFFEKEELLKAIANAKETGNKLHLFGLLSDGGVHSHMTHIKGLIDLCKKEALTDVYLHAFLDGRDTPPTSAINYIDEIEKYMNEKGVGKIASISGRYYSMDRDKRWERTEESYNMLTKGEGATCPSAMEAIKASYEAGVNDEFVKPTLITEAGAPLAIVEENDSIIFFNFRPDRPRQLTRAFVDVDFDGFARERMNTEFVCMTTYDATIEGVSVVFKPEAISNTLGEYLSSIGKTQLRIAETEKYAHVTFFFNGGVEEPVEGENRVLINSPKVATYDLQPEMSAVEVTDALIKELDTNEYDLIVLNFANSDMVGHTGIFDAAVKAVETVDACVGRVADKILGMGGSFILTADHGNAEKMLDESGEPMTAHTTNVVPCILVGQDNVELSEDGKLCDLAPTLLEMMGLDKPVEMTGKSLIKK